MKKLFLLGLLVITNFFIYGQKAEAIINAKETERIEKILSADEMMGRKTGTPGIAKASYFIAEEFKAAGLKPFGNQLGFEQQFTMLRPKFIELKAEWDGEELEAKKVIVVTGKEKFEADEKSGFETIVIKPGINLTRQAGRLINSGKNYMVLVDETYANDFSRISFLKRQMFALTNSVVFVLTNKEPRKFSIHAKHEFQWNAMNNVVGILPGKTKPDEFVIFSAHYDHIGTGKPVDGDSIFNGANDDAAGTTAVIMLAKYFKVLGNNERTLVFAAFTAEESGGYGSQYFSRQFDPAKVIAMFNIEMIGTDSKWGKNSAYITGYEKTDMGAIMQKNLEGTGFSFHPDPYPDQNLFYRSDNATMARLGVPAHTVSTAKMDGEPHYHKVSDEIETLDMENMSMIIKSIALSSRSIVSGKDTPARVKVEELK